MPGFLSYLGLENETDCVGGMTAAEWALGGSHPKSFEPEEVTAALCVPALCPRSGVSQAHACCLLVMPACNPAVSAVSSMS